MDINDLRIGITLVSFAAFLGIIAWAYRPARRAELEKQGSAILEDSES